MSELALLGGKRAKTKPFPLWPQFDDAERKALNEVLESRVWWRTPGTKTLGDEDINEIVEASRKIQNNAKELASLGARVRATG